MRNHLHISIAAFTALLGTSVVGTQEVRADPVAGSGRRQNDLEEQVAVRHRRLLVKNRLEVTPLFESSIDATYEHTVGGGLKLEYHFTDMLSFGVVGVGLTSINTGLVNNIVATLPDTPDAAAPRDPTKTEYLDHLNQMPLHGAAYVSITPWYGKLAAFSQAYVSFDFYFQAGVAFAELQSNCPTATVCTDTHPGTTIMDSSGNTIPPIYNPNLDPPLNSGERVGLYLGGGIHVFLSDFLALDLTVRDYAFSDNPSGGDVNADQYIGNNPKLGDDNQFLHHLFFGVGLSIMLPTTVKRTP